MKLRRITLSVTLIAVFAVTAMTAGLAFSSLNSAARTFEAQSALRNGALLSQWFEQDVRQLSELVRDHSLLPNVTAAVHAGDDTYAVYSLSVENIRALRLDEVWLVDAQIPGKIPIRIFADQYQAFPTSNLQESDDRRQRLTAFALSAVGGAAPLGRQVTAIVDGDHLDFVAVSPVRESSLINGPVTGALMMVRRYDKELIGPLRDIFDVPVSLKTDPATLVDSVAFVPQTRSIGLILVPLRNAEGEVVANAAVSVSRDAYRAGVAGDLHQQAAPSNQVGHQNSAASCSAPGGLAASVDAKPKDGGHRQILRWRSA